MALTTLTVAHTLKFFGILSVFVFAAVAVIHWKRANIDPRKPLGLTLDRNTGIELSVGTLIGSSAMLGTVCVESVLGLVNITTSGLTGHHILPSAASYLISGLVEELLCRGLLLSGLMALVRPRWLAVALMAALFGILHAANLHATPLSVLSNALGGVVYGLAYLGSKRLWLGTGVHFAWNFVEGPVLGFAVSGGEMPYGGLFAQSVNGPGWLTGASYGPEGGLICISFRFVAAGLILLWLRYNNRLTSA
jgi:membrane protease YdiL (CAAX protease family)